MKLSEAGLIGSSLIPEGTRYDNCFIGAALAAVGRNWEINGNGYSACFIESKKVWPWLVTATARNPITNIIESVETIIGHLNGWHSREDGWPRTRIAAWVASIEPQDEPATQPVEETANESTRQPA